MEEARTFKILASVFSFLGSLTQKDVDALINGSKVLTLSSVGPDTPEVSIRNQQELVLDHNNGGKKSASKKENFEFQDLVDQISALNDRKVAVKLIDDQQLTKANLEKIARFLRVVLTKSDNMERITEKIVEALVGSRLSSEAIRGS